MSIIMYLGSNVNEYEKNADKIIQEQIISKNIRCKICSRPIGKHSSYIRGIKETGQKIKITIALCKKCEKGHALLPDFLSPRKHYSGNEIEGVLIDSETMPANQIETEASESTVRRWISEVGGNILRATETLKEHFEKQGANTNTAPPGAGAVYSRLEQLLEVAPAALKHSGNKLGLANIWLGKYGEYGFV